MQLSKQLERIMQEMKVNFTLKGNTISFVEVFSATGLMPAIAKRADQLAQLCLGYGLGIIVEEDENALLGSTISFDEFTPNVLRLFCIVDILYEIVNMSSPGEAVELDEFLYD